MSQTGNLPNAQTQRHCNSDPFGDSDSKTPQGIKTASRQHRDGAECTLMLGCSLPFMKNKVSVASAWLDGDARRDAHLWGDSLLGLTNRPNDNSRNGQRINALRHTVHAIIYKVHLCITHQTSSEQVRGKKQQTQPVVPLTNQSGNKSRTAVLQE